MIMIKIINHFSYRIISHCNNALLLNVISEKKHKLYILSNFLWYKCLCYLLKMFSLVLEEKGVNLKLTVTDTPGFGDQINNSNW